MGSNQASFGLYRPFTGTVKVAGTDPLFGQIEEGKLIRLSYRGKRLSAFRVETVDMETTDAGMVKTASGRGALSFLESALVWYDPADPGTEREFTDTYAGILLTLLSEAQERGTLGLDMVPTFTADADSEGKDISGGTVTMRLQVGSTLLDYVRQMWERGIWIRTRWNWEQERVELDWIEPPYGNDRTQTVRFRLQHHHRLGRQTDATYLTTALLVKNGDAFLEVRDDDAIVTWGRRERMLSLDSAGSNEEAQALAAEVLAQDTEPRQSITAEVQDVDDGPRVVWDYDLGDIIAIHMPDTKQWENWRVVGFTLDFQDGGRAKVALELNREPPDYALAQARLVQKTTMGRQNEVAYQRDPTELQKEHEADPLAHRNLVLGDTGGDVSGTVTDATVVGLRGRPVADTAPNGGQVLTWNANAGVWEPEDPQGGSDDPPVGGDLNGTASDATVVGIQGVPVSSTAPADGQVLRHDGSEWAPTNLTADDVGADPAGSADAVQQHLNAHTADDGNPHHVTAEQAGALPLSGGEMTGDIILPGTPSDAAGAVPRAYVDGKSYLAAVSMPAFLTMNSDHAQTLPSGQWTRLVAAIENVQYDPDGLFDPATGTFTVPSDGIWLVGGLVTLYVLDGGKKLIAAVYVNGSRRALLSRGSTAVNDTFGVSGALILPLSAGDEVTLVAYHNRGQNATTPTDPPNGGYLSFWAVKLEIMK